MKIEEVKKYIRTVNDFPAKGVVFKDITTALKRKDCVDCLTQELTKRFKDKGITKVVGVESRGFYFASIIAQSIGAGFVPLRKKGKLPAETLEITYQKEYGTDTIQIHKDALGPDDVVLLHDDIMATGGTIEAATKLIRMFGVKKIYISFLGEIDFLNGRKRIDQDIEIDTLLHF